MMPPSDSSALFLQSWCDSGFQGLGVLLRISALPRLGLFWSLEDKEGGRPPKRKDGQVVMLVGDTSLFLISIHPVRGAVPPFFIPG